MNPITNESIFGLLSDVNETLIKVKNEVSHQSKKLEGQSPNGITKEDVTKITGMYAVALEKSMKTTVLEMSERLSTELKKTVPEQKKTVEIISVWGIEYFKTTFTFTVVAVLFFCSIVLNVYLTVRCFQNSKDILTVQLSESVGTSPVMEEMD